jgi:hypothetical protein
MKEFLLRQDRNGIELYRLDGIFYKKGFILDIDNFNYSNIKIKTYKSVYEKIKEELHNALLKLTNNAMIEHQRSSVMRVMKKYYEADGFIELNRVLDDEANKFYHPHIEFNYNEETDKMECTLLGYYNIEYFIRIPKETIDQEEIPILINTNDETLLSNNSYLKKLWCIHVNSYNYKPIEYVLYNGDAQKVLTLKLNPEIELNI